MAPQLPPQWCCRHRQGWRLDYAAAQACAHEI